MPIRVGLAKRGITPPVGVELCGYGFYLGRASTGVLDPLYARALALDDGATRVALVTCDLIGLMPRTVAEARARIETATGIPGSHVILACSHTHAGPATIDVRGCGEMDEAYVAGLPEALAAVVVEAAADMADATVGFGRAAAPGLALNRVEGEAGPMDDELVAMQVRRGDGVLATAYNVTAHGVSLLHTNTLISADWPGVAAGLIAEAGGGEGLFLQGSCGDVNPVLVHTGRHEEAGRIAAEAAARATSEIELAGDVSVAAASEMIDLPLDVTPVGELEAVKRAAEETLATLPEADENRAARATARLDLEAADHALQVHRDGPPAALQTEIQAIRVGDALLLAHGGELFVEYGLALKAMWAPRPVLVVGYANDFVGYIPDPEDFERGGYAAATVPKMCGNFPFTRDVGETLVRGIGELVGRVL